MSKVIITKSKLDTLAEKIATKAEISTPLTIDQMCDAVDSIETGTALVLQSKTVSPSSSTQNITPDSGYNGLSRVTINPVSSTEIIINSNGEYTATEGRFYSKVTVAIEDSKVNLQSKTATPSNVPVSVIPDEGYNGLSSVTVNPIPSNYADITNTTATINDVLNGVTFVSSSGSPKVGTLVVKSYYIGSQEPDSSIGEEGDLYLKV